MAAPAVEFWRYLGLELQNGAYDFTHKVSNIADHRVIRDHGAAALARIRCHHLHLSAKINEAQDTLVICTRLEIG
jgi:hypothetical protein